MSVTPKPSHLSLHWIWLIVLILLLDQGTKHLVVSSLQPDRPMAILPSIELVLSDNKGISFSWFQFAEDVQRWPLVGLSILASGLLAWWLSRVPSGRPILATGLALILGGALGNMLDRARIGSFIDFVHFFTKPGRSPCSMSPTRPSRSASSPPWRQHIWRRLVFARTAKGNFRRLKPSPDRENAALPGPRSRRSRHPGRSGSPWRDDLPPTAPAPAAAMPR
jgi:signal peptidase II